MLLCLYYFYTMKKYFIILPLLSFVFTFFCCAADAPPASIIFETDMGNDIDDALALDMLYKYLDAGKIKLLAIMSNKDSKYSSEYIDIMNHWYGYPTIPIGKVYDGVQQEIIDADFSKKISLMKNEHNSPLFVRSANRDFENAVTLYRRILESQPDNSVIIISTGFSTNLSKLLHSKADEFAPFNGEELVRKKVKLLSMMGGNFNSDSIKEYNIVKDINAADHIFSSWPTKIVVSPIEVGLSIKYPAESIENDFLWTKYHPLADGYKHFKKMPYNRPTWDLTSVLYVMEKDKNFFGLSSQGKVTVKKNGITAFKKKKNGKHRILTVTEKQREQIEKRFIEIISKKAKFETPILD